MQSMQVNQKSTDPGLRSPRRRALSLSTIPTIPTLATTLALTLLLYATAGCGSEPSPPREETGSEPDGHAASEEAGHEPEGGEEHAEGGEDVRIAPEVQERFGITTAPVGPGPVEVTLDLPGEIVSDPDRLVHVKPPFAGVIQRVFKHVGDPVEPGDPLAVVESSQALASYTVKAAIAGTIIAEHAAVGESVDRAHELFTIADTTVVWVQLQVFPSDLARVRVGDPVEVLLPNTTSGAHGEISFVTPVLDHVTRTASARVVLENDGAYQPGLFVTGRVAVERAEAALAIPTSALVREGRGWVVFVREGEDRFERRPVVVGHRGLERSEIEDGLEAGDEVVANGAFLVKSAAARGEMGGGHGH